MLITRRGFKAFNEYDLSQTLDAQISRLREEVKSSIQSRQTESVSSLVEKYKLAPLAFDIQNLTISTTTANIPAEYFPNNFFVERGQKYQKEILQFYLPYIGDSTLLKCVPSTRILWTEEIDIDGNNLVFELIKFSEDVENIRKERDKIIDYLTKQADNINKQITQYNNVISQIITETEVQTRSQISKHEEFLKQLGTPTRTEQVSKKAFYASSRPTRVTEKKEKKFDVFICHASEDKKFVSRLAKALIKAGVSPWYDNFQIGWGDDLRPTIDNGLENSRFGLVIFSEAFLGKKKWTEYELNGLFSKEKNGQKVILPIWYNISRENVSEYSPTFADRIAKRSDDIPAIVKELKKLLK